MIYAKDQWIQLPTRDLYDTQIMMASINAARDMYNKGQEQVKEFKKEYGDFLSPIQKDMDWYNKNVIGATRNFINDAYDKGIDLARSAEGRAMMQRFANNMPIGDINKLRQSAITANEYQKMRAKLMAEDKWNPEYEKIAMGGKTMEGWDTLNDGTFTRTSPSPYRGLNEMTSPWFDQLEPSFLYKKAGHDYYGIRDSEIDRTMRSNIPDFLNSVAGKYQYELARRQLENAGVKNITDDAIQKQLFTNIRNANAEKLQTTRKPNAYDLAAFEESLKLNTARKLRQDEQQANIPPALPSWSQQKIYDSQAKYNQGVGINGDRTLDNVNFTNTVNQIVKYWQEEEKLRAPSATGQKSRGYARRIANYWIRVGKEGVGKALKNGVFQETKDGLRASPVLAKQIWRVSQGHERVVSETESTKRASKYYNNFVVPTTPGADGNRAQRELAGQSEMVPYPGGYGKYYPVSMGDANVVYTPIRKLNVAGYKVDKNSEKYKFAKWLQDNNITGYIVNKNVTTASIPTRGGKQVIDINGKISIPAKLLAEYKDPSEWDINSVAKALGLDLYTKDGKIATDGKQKWSNIEYVHIPVTRTRMNQFGYSDANADMEYDNELYGKKDAEPYRLTRYAESMNRK